MCAVIEDHRRLDAQDARVVIEAVRDHLFELLHALHRDMHDEVMGTRHKEHAKHLSRDCGRANEPVDLIPLELGQLDHQQRFDPDPQRREIHLGVRAQQHATLP